MEDPIYRKLMEYSMRALSRRAHTSFELRQKLQKRPNCTPELEDQVLARLQDLNLINDEQYLKNAIEQSTRYKLEGPYKFASRLKRKGISMKESNELWNQTEISERALAAQALEKAAKRFAKFPQEKRFQKRAQFLASRGFSAELIFELAKLD